MLKNKLLKKHENVYIYNLWIILSILTKYIFFLNVEKSLYLGKAHI